MGNSQMDETILSATETSWRKVALVIVRVDNALGDKLPGDERSELIAKRIEVLVKQGRLLAQGNVANWRHSEIRKPISN